MSKAEINNEIVLMRKNVDQAKVQVIKKLTRDVTKLRQKKGTEAQKTKNQRKAERLAAEILSIKKMKKDEITKYILTNNLNLKEILENQNSTSLMRIMTRIANHKRFSVRISEFKSKYPNYVEFLGPGRKKQAKLERKEINKHNKSSNDNNESDNSDKEKENKLNNTEIVDQSDSESSDSECSEVASETQLDNEQSNNDLHNDENKEKHDYNKNKNKQKRKNEIEHKDEDNKISREKNVKGNLCTKTQLVQNCQPKTMLKQKKTKTTKDDLKHTSPKKKNNTIKVISNQALVKKFTDILKEEYSDLKENQEKQIEFAECNGNIEKEVDPFFLTEDGGANYLSVVLPKNKSNFEEDEHEDSNYNYNKRKFSHEQNDKFFNKVPKLKKSSTDVANPKWSNQERNFKSYEKGRNGHKADVKKFNSDYKNKSKSFSKPSNINFEQENDKVLHPSWEAKKKQQEILKKGFQGKKIVFDSDM